MKNLKKAVALLLVVLMLASSAVLFTSCSDVTEENPGHVIDLYMPYVINFDPATAYADEVSAKLLSLLYEGLTYIDEDGKVKGALADEWEIYIDRDNDKILEIKLKTSRWSDGTIVNASHFVDAWERVLDPEFNCQAAALLFPIKNAVDVKSGDKTESDLGVEAVNKSTLKITLERWENEDGTYSYANPDILLANFASVALYPIRQDIINKIRNKDTFEESDWSSLIAIMQTNGPFYLKNVSFGTSGADTDASKYPYMIFERNLNFHRDPDKDQALDKYVTPYRLKINMTCGYDAFQDSYAKDVSDEAYVNKKKNQIKATLPAEVQETITDEELTKLAIDDIIEGKFQSLVVNGTYIENLLSEIRKDLEQNIGDISADGVQYNGALPLTKEIEAVTAQNTMMTGTFLFNTNNEILKDAKVRAALSMALDREAIASLVRYATPANTLITSGVFNTDRKTSFKDSADYGISTTADKDGAKALLASAGVSGGTLTISVRSNEMDILVAQYAAEVWAELGFTVRVRVHGYDIITYSESVIVDERDNKGNLVLDKDGKPNKIKSEEVIYDGLLHDNYFEAYKNSDFDIMLYDLNMLSTDAFSALAPFASIYSGAAYDFSDSANFDKVIPHISGYVNEAYDAIMKEAFFTTDLAKRAELLHNAEKLLLEDLPITPLFYYQNAFVVSDLIDDITFDYFGSTVFSDATFETYVPKAESAEEETEAPSTEETPAE